ncbi:MOSC domain-containing protein [Flexivirga sp. ID2601S]|uniref:MOSC domain-containing protein n=1 Tax=Flexivirga aerilata TaxID=1656889 RepID=A0A849AJZ4_9MICO|nr:MOSC domain-containing protein [Flexivirga aerilata]
MGRVLSVNIGRRQPNSAKDTATGIDKQAVDSAQLRAPGPKHGGLGSGVVGDFVGDTRHHGGDDQAVYAVAREELDWWSAQLGRDLRNGTFGENLTTSELDVDHALIGERWQVGDEVVLRVAGPRIPCGTFRMHMGERGWLKKFVAHGLSGAYLAVEAPGTVRPGDAIRVLSRPGHDVDVPTTFRAFYDDIDAVRAVVDARAFGDGEHEAMVSRLAKLERRAARA